MKDEEGSRKVVSNPEPSVIRNNAINIAWSVCNNDETDSVLNVALSTREPN